MHTPSFLFYNNHSLLSALKCVSYFSQPLCLFQQFVSSNSFKYCPLCTSWKMQLKNYNQLANNKSLVLLSCMLLDKSNTLSNFKYLMQNHVTGSNTTGYLSFPTQLCPPSCVPEVTFPAFSSFVGFFQVFIWSKKF